MSMEYDLQYERVHVKEMQTIYRRIPVISPGLIQFRKGFRVGL